MHLFVLLSGLVCLAALFSFLNARWLRLPSTIGVMAMSLGFASVLIAVGHLAPWVQARAAAIVQQADFPRLVLHGMLAFLLFAGSLSLDVPQLGRHWRAVATLATLSTVLSAAVVAALTRLVLHWCGLPAGIGMCLLFGALISATDPVAVLEMLRRVGAPAELEAQLTGESLFNDGVGAVLFLTLLGATSAAGALPSWGSFLLRLALSAGGGIVLGLALGYLVFRMVSQVDSYRVEVLLTLALAMGGYALADQLALSAPLEAVAAGLVVNGHARPRGMSEKTRRNVDRFWELIDDFMNVVLFVLLGLELLVMPWNVRFLYAGLLSIPAVLFARLLSVSAGLGLLRLAGRQPPAQLWLLTWGGLRGALAVALALSIGRGEQTYPVLAITYIVVVFSILVQGGTMGALLRRSGLAAASPPATAALTTAPN